MRISNSFADCPGVCSLKNLIASCFQKHSLQICHLRNLQWLQIGREQLLQLMLASCETQERHRFIGCVSGVATLGNSSKSCLEVILLLIVAPSLIGDGLWLSPSEERMLCLLWLPKDDRGVCIASTCCRRMRARSSVRASAALGVSTDETKESDEVLPQLDVGVAMGMGCGSGVLKPQGCVKGQFTKKKPEQLSAVA
jgi:hypothetical protein